MCHSLPLNLTHIPESGDFHLKIAEQNVAGRRQPFSKFTKRGSVSAFRNRYFIYDWFETHQTAKQHYIDMHVCFSLTHSTTHRHQRCNAPSLCKTLLITNICRVKEAGQKKYLSHNVFFYNVFLSTSFSISLSHNVFLTTLSHNVFLITSFSQRLSHNVFLTTPVCLNIPQYLKVYTP